MQNLSSDACKLFMHEYHVDGFRLDATHSSYMDHGFLLRLTSEVRAVHPAALLVAENLPNQPDLNRQGWDGYAQWSELFHDKLEAVLRKGQFEAQDAGPANLADPLLRSVARHGPHQRFGQLHREPRLRTACPSRSTSPVARPSGGQGAQGTAGVPGDHGGVGTAHDLHGQRAHVERPRNVVTASWSPSFADHGFYQWARRVMRLRRRYPGLRLSRFDPAADGRFDWVLGP